MLAETASATFDEAQLTRTKLSRSLSVDASGSSQFNPALLPWIQALAGLAGTIGSSAAPPQVTV
jgi:hypothetical protein